MLIKVKTDEHKFTIPFPVMLGFMLPAGVTRKFIPEDINIADLSDKQLRYALRKMRKALRDSKKILNGAPLVDVKSSDGAEVKIFL